MQGPEQRVLNNRTIDFSGKSSLIHACVFQSDLLVDFGLVRFVCFSILLHRGDSFTS